MAGPSIILFLTACGSGPSAPDMITRNGISAMSNGSNVQLTFIKSNGHIDRYCAARESDVADTSSSGASLEADLSPATKDGVSEGSTQGALSLGGRDPAVLIVREMMYRACELSMNLNADADLTIHIYKNIMDTMKEITAQQTGNGIAALGQKSNSSVTISDSNSNSNTNSNSTNNSTSNTDSTNNSTSNTDSISTTNN